VQTFLLARGIDPAPLFRLARIPYSAGSECVAPLSPKRLATLLAATAKKLDDPHIGLTIGSAFKFEYAGLNALIMISSPNMQQALQSRIRYDTFVNSAMYDQIKTRGGGLVHGFRVSTIENIDLRHVHELVAAQMLSVLRTGTGRPLAPDSVSFCHPCITGIAHYRQHFSCEEIHFEQSINTMYYNKEVLLQAFPTGNRTLHKLLTDSVKQLQSGEKSRAFSDAVHREIIRLFDDGHPTLELVAANLCVSTRSLRRLLKEEGRSFQQVKQDALHKKASQLLALTNLPLREISYQLGYTEASTFSRAFRNWTGTTPQQYRDQFQS
jgi:AraC-like DNA-binding protein